jgi:type IV pilus assembly protein PilQ
MKHIFLLSILLISNIAFSQIDTSRIKKLEKALDTYAKDNPKVKEKADIAFDGNLKDFITALAVNHELNLTVNSKINAQISNNFSDVAIRDVLLFICQNYNLTLVFTGSIISIEPVNNPPSAIPPPKEPTIDYNTFNQLITIRLENDTLAKALKKISTLTGINAIPTREIRNDLVGFEITGATVETAIYALATAQQYEIDEENGYFTLSKKGTNENTGNNTTVAGNNNRNTGRNNTDNNTFSNTPQGSVKVRVKNDSSRLITINAVNVPIVKVLNEVSNKRGIDYYLFAEPEGLTTIQLTDITYDEFLRFLLEGTNFTYRQENDIYLIGEQQRAGVRMTKVLQLQHRPTKDVLPIIPDELIKGVQIDTFPELNALIISGSNIQIFEIEAFVKAIDRPVPNVEIELIIMDVQYNRIIEAGIEAGIASEPVTPGGQLYPSADFTLSANSVNGLLDLLANQGNVNIGRVQPNFYVSLKAIEDNGLVKVTSKPRIATLNSHAAVFSIGETRYYQEQTSNVQGGITPVVSNQIQFKELKANFTIEVTPYISADENVTLYVSVDQTDFLGEIQTNAPSPQVTRTLSSQIRVKNGEMIVIGGLEGKRREDSGRGVPFLSRIPVIKWLFSSRKNTKNNSKLLIFIKPTITY